MTARVLPRTLCNFIRRPNVKPRYEMRIPDKWLEYSRIGEQMPDLPFICFKTPLSESFNYSRDNQYGLTEDEEFTPTQLYDEVKRRGIKLGMVIDLTNTYRYYDGRKELEDRFGIKYTKIKFDAYNPLCFTAVFKIFSKQVRKFLEGAETNEVIGVHCTHGIHRTGYMICRYLIEERNYNMDHAVNLFNKSRGHDMEKYLEGLREIWMERSRLGGESSDYGKESSRRGEKTFHIVRKRRGSESKTCLENASLGADDTEEVANQRKKVSLKEKPLAEGHVVENVESPGEHFVTGDSNNESEFLQFDNDEKSLDSTERTRAL